MLFFFFFPNRTPAFSSFTFSLLCFFTHINRSIKQPSNAYAGNPTFDARTIRSFYWNTMNDKFMIVQSQPNWYVQSQIPSLLLHLVDDPVLGAEQEGRDRGGLTSPHIVQVRLLDGLSPGPPGQAETPHVGALSLNS